MDILSQSLEALRSEWKREFTDVGWLINLNKQQRNRLKLPSSKKELLFVHPVSFLTSVLTELRVNSVNDGWTGTGPSNWASSVCSSSK